MPLFLKLPDFAFFVYDTNEQLQKQVLLRLKQVPMYQAGNCYQQGLHRRNLPRFAQKKLQAAKVNSLKKK